MFLLDKIRELADRHLPAHMRHARRGEDLANDYLRRHGYRIVARNFRPRSGRGEVDLIGWDGDRLAFIEVKTRGSEDFGRPERAVDRRKSVHLVRCADDYIRRAGVDPNLARFDVVSIILGAEEPEIQLLKDVFSRRSIRRR